MPSPSQQVIAARCAIALMAIVPAIGFIAGLLAEPGKPRDAIAVTTVCALFFVIPGCGIAAGLALWRIPPRRLLLRRLIAAACLSVAALVCVADFWLIGIHAGLKSQWLKLYSVPIAVLLVLTACQWPGQETAARCPASSQEQE